MNVNINNETSKIKIIKDVKPEDHPWGILIDLSDLTVIPFS